jgi:hypothetical protein
MFGAALTSQNLSVLSAGSSNTAVVGHAPDPIDSFQHCNRPVVLAICVLARSPIGAMFVPHELSKLLLPYSSLAIMEEASGGESST